MGRRLRRKHSDHLLRLTQSTLVMNFEKHLTLFYATLQFFVTSIAILFYPALNFRPTPEYPPLPKITYFLHTYEWYIFPAYLTAFSAFVFTLLKFFELKNLATLIWNSLFLIIISTYTYSTIAAIFLLIF